MNREDVIRGIVERDMRNLSLSEGVVQGSSQKLFAAACEHFGTWETALKYAGVSLRRVTLEGEYSRERVLSKLRKLCYDGYDLSARHNARRDWRLYTAVLLQFGSWRNALRVAGLKSESLRSTWKPRRYQRTEIIEELRKLNAEGLPLTWGRVCMENRALAISAKTVFLSWRRALMAAGLAPEERVKAGGPKWNRERVIEALKARSREGKLMTVTATRKEDLPLAAAVRRYFESWAEALRAAGVEAEKRGVKGGRG